MNKPIQPVKGTRDFYPENMTVRTWLYDAMREVSESFGYQEYEGPFLETLELYAAKSGEELVNQQSYVFQDRGGEWVTLRPELTPTLVRMIAQRQKQLVFPLRWWSWGPMWRYERPQKGRAREFFQWNVDMVGVNSPEADAEMVAVLATFFQKVGLTPKEVSISVNNRRLMDAELTALEIIPGMRSQVSTWIDRRDKLPPDEWRAYGREIGLSDSQVDGLTAVQDNQDLWRKSDEMVRFFAALDALGVKEYVRFDPGIVRGLLYYTGTVIEAFEIGGEIRRSILGGGRYDNLMADVGGDPLPGVGFALGDMVITLVLQKYNLLPKDLGNSQSPLLVTVFSEELLLDSYRFAAQLRRAGFNVLCYPEAVKLPKQFKFADRMGIRFVTVIGPDESAAGLVTIKDLSDSSQISLPQDQAGQKLVELLAPSASS